MQQTPRVKKQPASSKQEEHILVVKRDLLIPQGTEWHGLNTGSFDNLFQVIKKEQEFHPRSLMETDPTYKQVIPYLVFTHNEKYFLMQRQAQASEQRLKNKYSLGIGGHIRQEDLEATDIMGWAEREFNEEVSYSGTYTVEPLGILNDDSNAVGQVHIGLVLLVKGESADISVKSELKSGTLYTLEECRSFYPRMEGWSQMVYDTIANGIRKPS